MNNNKNSMGYMVPFLTMSSILIDLCFSNVIFIGSMFNSYNYWYLLSYSNQFMLHYSMLLIIVINLMVSWLVQSILDYINTIPSLILSSFFSNYTFFIPIFLDYFELFSTFFFKGPINSIEVFTGFIYSILFIHFLSLFFYLVIILAIVLVSIQF